MPPSPRSAATRLPCGLSAPKWFPLTNGWDRICERYFGAHPSQVCFDWKTAVHAQAIGSSPGRRPFTRRELQTFFDRADDEVHRIASLGRKGWLPAYRDAVLFKVAYCWGLRRNEAI